LNPIIDSGGTQHLLHASLADSLSIKHIE